MIKRTICRIRGHDWKKRPVQRRWNFDDVVGVCDRCGKEATRLDAATIKAGGPQVPSELLDQSPEDELTALYRDGRIDEDELEYFMEKVVSAE